MNHVAVKTAKLTFGLLRMPILLCGFWVLTNTSVMAQSANEKSEWKPVEDAMGRSGKLQPGDVLKFGMPRKDLQVTVRGTQVKPGLALGSWAAFKKMGNE